MNLKNKIKLVKEVLGGEVDVNFLKKEIITMTDEEFFSELDKLRKEVKNA
ncbi:MAG: hypothetical protein AB7G52_15065 [Arcobacter sp.]